MCYSALVNQDLRKLSFQYKARIQIDLFDSLFKSRLEGSGAKISRALEVSFLKDPSTLQERRIAKMIREFRNHELEEMKTKRQEQTDRLSAAEKTLLTKVTKKAQNDQRVATKKIEDFSRKIERLESDEITERDSRIFPGQYAPLLVGMEGERLIRPFRYHLRPQGQSEDFDRKFDGNYNARRDRLKEVFWWKSVFGKNHGVLPIRAFYENVKRHDSEHRMLKDGEAVENLILKFQPEGLDEMIVPCIWDQNTAGKFTLDSFALITDEPNPEVAAAGHDRTPIIMRDQYLDQWLMTSGRKLTDFEIVFEDKQPTFFAHEIAA